MQPHPYLPHHHPRRVRIQCASSVLLIGTVLLLCQPALATDLHSHAHHASPSHAGEATSPHRGHAHDHDDADDAAGHSPHDSSRTADVRRDEIPVAVPDRSLVDRHGRSVHLNTLLDTDEVVLLNFVFTTCTAICPVMSSSFSSFREANGEAGHPYRMISISIDPEHDTPDRLSRYAERHGASDATDWHFLTGDHGDIVAIQRAFGAFRGNKMNHEPATYLWRRGRERWIRLSGLPSPSQLAEAYDELVAERPRSGGSAHAHHDAH